MNICVQKLFRLVLVRTSYNEVPKYGNHCAGVFPYNLWQIDTNETILMDINTTACAFESTPLYLSIVMGITNTHSLVGFDAINFPTKQGFRVYARTIRSWTVSLMYGYSQTYEWNIHWLGYYNL